MSQPKHAAHPGDCTFLGTLGRFDLYFGPQGLPVPEVIARWGSGANFHQWPVDSEPASTVQLEVFDHAVTLARKKGYLE
ncbi:hypothetical protein [Pseudomonas veronii]|uniref:hypothetical protein n=1 Tax=Pseudomonas veronii TaxID=76761 RepID=UPI0019016F27|nr:hypothetical protein [Pseudomonas veronii]